MKKLVFLGSITSDIGTELARRYQSEGYDICGTFRDESQLKALSSLTGCHFFYCDLAKPETIQTAVQEFARLGRNWETFISCAGFGPPLTPFFESPFDDWFFSVRVNAIEQLRLFHALYPLRETEKVCNALFFAGPGTNNAPKSFSALTVSKIMLIKMCELLDAENPDLNVFIVGPGWVKTKAHDRILADPNVSSEKKAETVEFMKTQKGTPMQDIYDCIRWLCKEGRPIAGGRNFSVVHDTWGHTSLAAELRKNANMYKLRRYGNEFKDKWEKKRWM